MSEFVEVNTADLVGAALDWAVANIEVVDVALVAPAYGCGWRLMSHRSACAFRPSTDWSQVGPLIHKYQIEFCANSEDNHAMHASLSAWRRYGKSHRTRWSSGQDHLIAACRAIVASVLGETVSVPKELLS